MKPLVPLTRIVAKTLPLAEIDYGQGPPMVTSVCEFSDRSSSEDVVIKDRSTSTICGQCRHVRVTVHRIRQHVCLIPVRASVDREEEWKLRTPRQFLTEIFLVQTGSQIIGPAISLLQTLTRISQVDARAQLMKHPKDTQSVQCAWGSTVSAHYLVYPQLLACTAGGGACRVCVCPSWMSLHCLSLVCPQNV